MNNLRSGIATGESARFNRAMIYRAIRPLARFHDDYKGMDEIVMNSSTLAASSQISFSDVKKTGNYHTHPAIIDSLTQSCAFTMNCNDANDLDTQVFMNHGWGSFQIFEPIDYAKTYTTYTHMTEGDDKLWKGDVVVFDGEKVVAYIGQVAVRAHSSASSKQRLTLLLRFKVCHAESSRSSCRSKAEASRRSNSRCRKNSLLQQRLLRQPAHRQILLLPAEGPMNLISRGPSQSSLKRAALRKRT